MREDKPLVAPSLLELSACVIAKDDGRYLFFKEQCMVNPSPSETSFFLSQSDSVDSQVVGGKNTVELPVNCAETVFNCVRSNLKQYEPNGEAEQADVDASVPTFAALCPFFNGIHCPISKLDLSNLYISDRILAGLLNGQQHTLTCLDLSYVQVCHIYYVWSRAFFPSGNKINFCKHILLVIGSSVILIPNYGKSYIRMLSAFWLIPKQDGAAIFPHRLLIFYNWKSRFKENITLFFLNIFREFHLPVFALLCTIQMCTFQNWGHLSSPRQTYYVSQSFGEVIVAA